jgi:hypothetical protein
LAPTRKVGAYGFFKKLASALWKASAFFSVENNIFVFEAHLATRGAVNFYSTGVVTHDRKIGSRLSRLIS